MRTSVQKLFEVEIQKKKIILRQETDAPFLNKVCISRLVSQFRQFVQTENTAIKDATSGHENVDYDQKKQTFRRRFSADAIIHQLIFTIQYITLVTHCCLNQNTST